MPPRSPALRVARLLALALTIPTAASAQEVEWARSAGSTENEYMKATAVDATGHTVVAGQFFSLPITFGAHTLTGAGLWDMFLARYSPSGEVLWARGGGGTGIDHANGVGTDAAGNVFVAGQFVGSASFGLHTLTSAGGQDIFVAKYGPDGTLLWARKAGGGSDEAPEAVGVDAAGNAYVVGIFGGVATFDSVSLTSAGAGDVFVAKFSPDGAVLWAVRAGGPGNEFGEALAVDASGDVLITGEFSRTATFGGTALTSAGSTDAFVARLDAAGAVQWARRAGGTGEDLAFGLDLNAAGEAYVAGTFLGTAAFGTGSLTSVGGSDVFLAKYAPDGGLLWARRGGGFLSDIGESVAVDVAGAAYVSGYFPGEASFGAHTVASEGGQDIFVAGYSSDGTPAWAMRVGGPGTDWLSNVALHGAGDLRLAGTYRETATVGPTTLVGAGLYDLFLASVNVAGTVGTEAPSSGGGPSLEAPWPNPAAGVATVRFWLPAATPVRLTLYDALGRELAVPAEGPRPGGTHEVAVNLSGLPPALYFLRLQTPDGDVARPLVVAR